MIDRDFEASMQATYRRVDFARGYDRLPVEIWNGIAGTPNSAREVRKSPRRCSGQLS